MYQIQSAPFFTARTGIAEKNKRPLRTRLTERKEDEMKDLSKHDGGLEKQTRRVLTALFCLAFGIVLSGIFFFIYSLLSGISFKVLNTNVPGFVLGLFVVYFGVRSILSVSRLRQEISRTGAHFSWANFKREKGAKIR